VAGGGGGGTRAPPSLLSSSLQPHRLRAKFVLAAATSDAPEAALPRPPRGAPHDSAGAAQKRQRRLPATQVAAAAGDARALTAQLTRCASVESLAAVCGRALPSFNAIHVSAALTRCAHLAGGGGGRTSAVRPPVAAGAAPVALDALLDALCGKLDELSAAREPTLQPRQLANALWALARLRASPPAGLMANLAAFAVDAMPDASADDAAVTLWALAALRGAPPVGDAWWPRFWAGSLRLLPAASGQNLSNMAYAAAQLGAEPPAAWLAALRERAAELATSRGGGLTPQALSNMLWALATLAAQRAEAGVGGERAAAAVAAELAPAAWLGALLSAGADDLAAGAFEPAQLSSTLWSLAALRRPPPPAWLAAALSALEAALPRCSGACARARLPRHAAALARPSRSHRVHGSRAPCSPPAFIAAASVGMAAANSLWALQQLAPEALRGALPALLPALAANRSRLAPRDATAILGALSAAGHAPEPALLSRLLSDASPAMAADGPGGPPIAQLPLLLDALAQMGTSPPAGWWAATQAPLAASAPGAAADDLARLLSSSTVLRASLAPATLAAVLSSLQPRLTGLSHAALAQLLASLARGAPAPDAPPPPPDFVAAALDAACNLAPALPLGRATSVLCSAASLAGAPGASLAVVHAARGAAAPIAAALLLRVEEAPTGATATSLAAALPAACWALARLGLRPGRRWLAAVLAAHQRALPDADGRDVARMVRALASWSRGAPAPESGGYAAALAARSCALLHTHSAQQLAALGVAAAALRSPLRGAWLEAFCAVATARAVSAAAPGDALALAAALEALAEAAGRRAAAPLRPATSAPDAAADALPPAPDADAPAAAAAARRDASDAQRTARRALREALYELQPRVGDLRVNERVELLRLLLAARPRRRNGAAAAAPSEEEEEATEFASRLLRGLASVAPQLQTPRLCALLRCAAEVAATADHDIAADGGGGGTPASAAAASAASAALSAGIASLGERLRQNGDGDDGGGVPVAAVVDALSSCAAARRMPPPAFTAVAVQALAAGAPRLSARQRAQALWSLAVLQVAPPPEAVAALATGGSPDDAGGGGWEGLAPRQLARLLCALAKLGHQPGAPWLADFNAQARRAGGADRSGAAHSRAAAPSLEREKAGGTCPEDSKHKPS